MRREATRRRAGSGRTSEGPGQAHLSGPGSELDQSAKRLLARIEHGAPVVLDPCMGEELRLRLRSDHQLGLNPATGQQARQHQRAGQAAGVPRNMREQASHRTTEAPRLLEGVRSRYGCFGRTRSEPGDHGGNRRSAQSSARLEVCRENLDGKPHPCSMAQALEVHYPDRIDESRGRGAARF